MSASRQVVGNIVRTMRAFREGQRTKHVLFGRESESVCLGSCGDCGADVWWMHTDPTALIPAVRRQGGFTHGWCAK